MNAADGGFLLPTGLETVPLDMAVLTVLADEFGWLSAFAVTKRLQPELQDEKKVEASLRRLAKAQKALIRERHGNTDLFRFPPRPGEEATAEVRPDPAPRGGLKYSGPDEDQIPPPRARGQRLTVHIAPQPLMDERGIRKLTKALNRAAHATPKEAPMRITKDQVLQLLASGPKTREEIAKALKCSEEAPGYHLAQLQKEGKVHKPEGRMGPWALRNGAVPQRGPTPVRARVDVDTLRWSINNDGGVTFRAGDASIDVAGEVLERVQRARQAILEAS